MMGKHTVGPWSYEYNNDVGPNDDSFWEFYEVSANDALIGRIENESDARLIAAAPDLLEALEALVSADSVTMHSAMTRAESAIKKARGES